MKYIALTAVTPRGEATVPAGEVVNVEGWTEERLQRALDLGLIAKETDEEALAEVLPLAATPGVSTETAVTLAEAGIVTPEDLTSADSATVAEETGLSPTVVKRTQTAAKRAAEKE